MKNIIKTLTLPLLFVGLMSTSYAQRSGDSRGESARSAPSSNRVSSERHMERRSAPVRTFNNNRQSHPVARTTPTRTFNNNSNRTVTRTNNYNDRSIASRNNYNRTYNVTRTSNYRSYPESHYYGNVYGRRTYLMAGPRYTVIPHSFISIRFGGNPYYYNHGYYYGYYGGYYQPIFPPFGLQIGILPFGYSTLYYGGMPFYYYNGIYYRQYNNSYQVVDAPMGAIVSSLPQGIRSVNINGEQMYELNGTFYKAETDANGNTVYEVIGKNGVINNTNSDNQVQQVAPQDDGTQIGDILNSLPDNSKIVTVNGQELYETPDNIYLQKLENDGNVQYKVVGK
ncbi:MAG TPA: DUF6515 family protein [Hanamia sp.]